MSIRNLDPVLDPRSVAVIGASERMETAGARVLARIVAGGFAGEVWPVNPRRRQVQGLACFASAVDLPRAPDLAVVAAPADAVPTVIAELGARGCRVAVVLTEVGGRRQAMLDAARPHLLRVIGPGSEGVIAPRSGLDACLAPADAAPGAIALVSQSGTIAAALLDRAAEHGIGFSHVASLGGMADVDAGDYLDLLAGDGRTRAILLYLESIPEPRKFLSAARAAARLKPVIAVKAGRSPEAAEAAASHTGALAGADDVVDAALARAGVLRVRGLSELFEAAETIARFRPLPRARLGIVTNSGGAGVLALDRLAPAGGELAALGSANPLDIGGGATPEGYVAALEAVAADPAAEALLVMHCPTADAPPEAAAQAVAVLIEKGSLGGKPVFACWMGGASARAGRAVLRARGVASYDAPATAVAAVGHLTGWGRAQAALLLVPDRRTEAALQATPAGAQATVAAIFARAAKDGRRVLALPDAQAVLEAYGFGAPPLRVARSPAEVGKFAAEMLPGAGRVVVKLLSRDIAHKSVLGGVMLDIASAEEATEAARTIEARVRAAAPDAVLEGFALQPMVRRPQARELILGVGRDPSFGPVILFGAGGVAVERVRDTAVALPPLDAGLAAELIGRTRVGAFLNRDAPQIDPAALQGALIALSHLVEDFPCLRTVDVNPLIADADGLLALDAHVEIDPGDMARHAPNPDLVIRPYPSEWRRTHGDFALRPIRPADALLYPDFLARLDPEHIRLRFLAPRRGFTDEFALRMTQLDYDRDMAFVALAPDGSLAGVARVACDPDHRAGEYALLVRSDLQGRGLGKALMQLLIDYARADGLERLEGMVLGENSGMRDLVERLGFTFDMVPDEPGVVMSRLTLRETAAKPD